MMILELVIKWLIPFVCGGIATGFITYFQMRKTRDRAIEHGVQCLLRLEIIRNHEKYTTQRFCPVDIKEAIRRMYDAYTHLGGNDIATRMYNEILELPISLH